MSTTSDKMLRVRQARRQGWHVVSTRDLKVPASWNQLYDWLTKNAQGRYVESFYLQEVAFELEKDANWFSLRWI